jgi:hypothetical protein
MILKNKKQLEDFLRNRDQWIEYLADRLNEYGVKSNKYEDLLNKVDEIQKFYEDKFESAPLEVQDKLRVAFWAFFSKLLMNRLGGEIKIASKTDYSAGTPQLVNYGNKFDKNGKKKWIGIGFNSWLESHVSKNALVSLNGKIEKLLEDYS